MSKTRFLAIPLMTLIIIGLLVAGGWAIHRIGWSQGYAMGQLAAGGEAGALVPHAPWGVGHLGLFLTVGLVLLLSLMVIGKIFRFWAWKMVGLPWMMAHGPWKTAPRPNGEYWRKRWHRPHDSMHPWCWGWEKPSDGEAGEAGSDAETGAAETQA